MSVQSSDIPRIGKGVEGRAVRLGEVIGWIAAREEMPKGDAIDYAMQVLCGPESCTLYQIHVEGCSGKPLDVNVEWFASHNGKEDGHTGGRRILSRGLDPRGVPYPLPKPPSAPALGYGMEGFTKWLRAHFLAALKANQQIEQALPWAVIAQTDARRLFGWCPPEEAVSVPTAVPAPAPAAVPAVLTREDVTSPETLDQFMQQFAHLTGRENANKRPRWTPEMRKHLPGVIQLKFEQVGPDETLAKKALATQWGLTTCERINELLRVLKTEIDDEKRKKAAEEAEKQPAHLWGGLGKRKAA